MKPQVAVWFCLCLGLATSFSLQQRPRLTKDIPDEWLPLENNSNDTDLAGRNNSRIVGGSNAPDGAFPYQVSIRSPSNSHFCGGSIVNQNWILTAAHCVHRKGPYSMKVVVGTNLLNAGGQTYTVAQVVWHPAYNPQSITNDIALLKIAGSITYGAKVRQIGLVSAAPTAGAQAVLSGWGLTRYPSSQLPKALQQINLRVIGTAQCKTRWNQITANQVCTYTAPAQGACQGDSGGPLAVAGQQIGVVSFGMPCARGYPDVFTSVAAYRTWIKQYTGV